MEEKLNIKNNAEKILNNIYFIDFIDTLSYFLYIKVNETTYKINKSAIIFNLSSKNIDLYHFLIHSKTPLKTRKNSYNAHNFHNSTITTITQNIEDKEVITQ